MSMILIVVRCDIVPTAALDRNYWHNEREMICNEWNEI
jgi:hypothetical protein